MTEVQITETVLLTIAGWILIGIVVKDIILTARLCLAESAADSGRRFKVRRAYGLETRFPRNICL